MSRFALVARAHLLWVVLSILGMASASAQTVYWSAGATCAGGASTTFSTGGPNFQISLCADTLASGRGLCNATIQPQAANGGESGRFVIASRVIGANISDETSVNPTNIAIANPPDPTDFGGTTSNPAAAPAAANGQILATFNVTPQASATNASYVISLSGASSIDTAPSGASCLGGSTLATAPSITLNLFVAPSAPTFTSSPPLPSGTVGAAYAGYTFTATGNPPAITFSAPALALPPGLTLSGAGVLSGTPTAAGTFPFTVTAQNTTGSTTQNVSVTIGQGSQVLTFPAQTATQPFSAGSFAISPLATSAAPNSGNAITYSSTTAAVCTVAGTTVTIVSAGLCTIAANQAGNSNYTAAAQVTQSVTINASAPAAPTGVTGSATGPTTGTVSFTAPNNGGSAITGYTVTCSPAGGTDVNAGTTSLSHSITGLTTNQAYTCTVVATNAIGPSAPSAASNSFTPVIAPVTPVFTSANAFAGFTVGVAGTTFPITATGFGPPTITSSASPIGTSGVNFTSGGAGTGTATLSGTPTGAGTFNVTFTATNTLPLATPSTATQSFTLTVAKGTRVVNFTGPAPQPYSATPIALIATTTPVGGVITFATSTPTICSISGSSVTMLAVGTCTITANSASDVNYNAASSAPQSFAISAAPQTITFGAQASPRGFSASPVAISPLATASSGLPITYTSATPGTCSVSGATFTTLGLGTCTISAAQAGDARFTAATTVQQNITISIGSQTISFAGLPNQSLGTAPFTISASVTSGLPATFVSQTPTVCTTTGVNGSTVTLLILGTCTIQASQAGNANYSAATPVTASFTVVPPGAVTLSSSTNPAAYRAPVLLSASVEGTTPTGTITFAVSTPTGSVTLCSGVPLVNARATCPVSGTLNIANPVFYTATYSGDGNNPANSTTLQQLVNVNSVTMNVTVNPIQPVAGRNVELRATLAGRNLTNKVSFNENGLPLTGCSAVTVSLLPGATDLGVATCTVSAISAATHNYVVTYPHTADAGFEQQIVTVTPLIAAPVDYTDMWWVGSSENGWGVSITQHGMTQFIVLYVYDDNGKPIWYSMPGGSWNANQTAYTGALYQPTSAPFSLYDALQFRPGGPTGASVGTATVTYTSASTATLTYTINGKSGTKAIVRQPYATDDGQAKLQVADLWWAGAAENGWGLNIAQQGRVLFPIWYTYDGTGRDTWFAMPGGTWSGSVYTGDLYTTISSGWLGTNYNPSQFVVTKVGTMSLDFSDQNNAILTYTVNNLTQRKVIVRQPF